MVLQTGVRQGEAQADDKIPNVIGTYGGIFDSSVTMMSGGVLFEITRQEGRHFWGMVIFGGMAGIGFEFDGTVNAKNEFKGKGSGAAGEVTFDGTLTGPLPDGPFVIMAHYVFMSAMGGMDEGMVFATNGGGT